MAVTIIQHLSHPAGLIQNPRLLSTSNFWIRASYSSTGRDWFRFVGVLFLLRSLYSGIISLPTQSFGSQFLEKDFNLPALILSHSSKNRRDPKKPIMEKPLITSTSQASIKNQFLMGQFLEFHHLLKNEVISWARFFIHVDLHFQNKVAMFWRNFIEMNYSLHLICFSIIALVATLVWIMKSPNFRARLRAANCEVKVGWNQNNPNRVGGVVLVKLTVRKPSLSLMSTARLDSYLNGESLASFMSKVKIRVFVDQQEVIVNKEVSESDQSIHGTFPVHVSGKYAISLTYSGVPLSGSPFTTTMEADEIDISKTYLEVRNPLVIVKNRQFRMDVIPVDMYGNRCHTTLDTMRRLKVDVVRVEKGVQKQEIDGFTDFKFNTGIRRENPDIRDFSAIYSIYGKCQEVGNYEARISIDEVPITLPTPCVEVICISGEEDEIVRELKSSGLCKFEGYLICPLPPPVTSDVPAMAFNEIEEDVGVRVVSVELSLRFVFLSRRVLNGPFERRMDTWRIGGNTKVEISSIQDEPEPDTHIMKISNILLNTNQEVVMKGQDARMLLVMFYQFLAAQRNPLVNDMHESSAPDNFAVKVEKFYQGIRESFDPSSCEVHFVTPNYRTFTVTRADIVETTLQATKAFTRLDWGKPFIVAFRHETMKLTSWINWAEELAKEIFESSVFGMFVGHNSTIGNRQRSGLIHPNGDRNNRWKLEHYALAGKLVGKCIVERALNPKSPQHWIDARFSRTILAMILGVSTSYKHLQMDDPDYFQSNFETVLQNDVSSMGLHFVIRNFDKNGELKIHELLPNGANIVVTNENKIHYLNELAKFHMCRNVLPEIRASEAVGLVWNILMNENTGLLTTFLTFFSAFISGLNLLIPGRLLMMFDENELELVLCNSSPLNLKNLIQHYHGSENNYGPNFDKLKSWLRIALEGMDTTDLGRFYQFVTGSSRLPKEGFIALRPSLGMSALFGQIPTANKTQCHLIVTDHPSYESFANSLMTAIRKNDFE